MITINKLPQYELYYYGSNILIILMEDINLPYFNDCVASQASGVGVDLTDPKNWDTWPDACLCWNVLDQCHEFHDKHNLRKFEIGNQCEGYIPFDIATGNLRSILSLLKFSQDKMYKNHTFQTTLKRN